MGQLSLGMLRALDLEMSASHAPFPALLTMVQMPIKTAYSTELLPLHCPSPLQCTPRHCQVQPEGNAVLSVPISFGELLLALSFYAYTILQR
jgi:hypothetical protein